MSIEASHSELGFIPEPSTAVPDGAVGLTPWRDPAAVLTAVRQLVASPEPAVVLTSLAAACASAIADECWATVEEVGATQPITIAMPPGAGECPTPAPRTPLAGADQLTLRFSASAWEHYPEFSGTMTWRWHDRDRPTGSDKVIAQLLLDRALELVHVQRLEAASRPSGTCQRICKWR